MFECYFIQTEAYSFVCMLSFKIEMEVLFVCVQLSN
jgi:hypothetical protein